MTGRVIRIPFRSDLSPDEEIMLEAATEWLLTEIENNPFRTDERISVGSMRSIAEKELRRPRDEIHRLWAEAFIRETDGIEFDHVRPEIRALVRRGNVTPAEIKELRCNSWEWEALVPAMNDEAFIDRMEYALNNCFTKRERPYSTYNQAIEGLYVPELLKRFDRISNDLRVAVGVLIRYAKLDGEVSMGARLVLGFVQGELLTVRCKECGEDLVVVPDGDGSTRPQDVIDPICPACSGQKPLKVKP